MRVCKILRLMENEHNGPIRPKRGWMLLLSLSVEIRGWMPFRTISREKQKRLLAEYNAGTSAQIRRDL